MKYAVDMSEHAGGSLEDDNLKGERRWERQVVRSLLDAGRVVGSVCADWANPDSPHWAGVIKNLRGHALITESDPARVRFRPGAECFVSNSFSHLLPCAEEEIREAIRLVGRNRVILTHSFQSHVPLKRLSPDLHDLIRWLPVPAVPAVHLDHEPWRNKMLLWSARGIHLYLMPYQPRVVALLEWIRGCLREDPELRFEILLGEERIDQAGADAWVWRFPEFAHIFDDARDRVYVHPSRSWREVQGIYARAKLVVNAVMIFGGPPIESAAFGIPTAGTEPLGVFHVSDPAAPDPSLVAVPGFPEYRGVEHGQLLEHLDRWHRNEADYRATGDAYRRYVDKTYTYAAFLRHLDALPVFQ